MAITRFKFANWELTRGVIISELELLKTIKICETRNTKLTNKYIEVYEFLTDQKFDKKLLKEI